MRVSSLIAAALLAGCASELPPRGQVVLAVDTDAPLADPPLFDRVLVEIFPPVEANPCEGCSRELPIDVAKVRAGRFSFGFAPRPRVLGYTARFHAEDVGKPRGTLASPLVFDKGEPLASAEGTWPPARPADCGGPPPGGAACVAGGAFFMGDPRVSVTDAAVAGAKEHLVVLSPYFLDEHEVTVAALRASGLAWIDSRGRGLDPVDDLRDDVGGRCDYSVASGPWDERPVDCVSWQLAQAYCRSKGGDLPTEAQLERVATARGTSLAPWGDRDPPCEEAAVSRGVSKEQGGCSAADPLALGARVIPERPGSGGRDRVGAFVDLGANLAEWARDAFEGDDGPCWSAALLFDPVCNGDPSAHSTKGGDLLRVPVDFAPARRGRPTRDRSSSYPEEREPLAQEAPGLRVERLARRPEPARNAHAMHAVREPDLLDREPLDVHQAEHVALARRQCPERVVERLLERRAVPPADLGERGIVVGRERGDGGVPLVAALGALGPERRVDDHRAHERAERPLALVRGDRRRFAVLADEELLSHDLPDLLRGCRVDAEPRERAPEVGVAAPLDLRDRARIARGARARDVEIVAHLGQGYHC